MAYETILVEREERVGIITLNRPKALNALNSQVMKEVTTAATELDNDPAVGAIIITGSAKAFAAGADIKEMAGLTFADAFGADFFATWTSWPPCVPRRSRRSPGTPSAVAASWR